jgi:hypothetical protein
LDFTGMVAKVGCKDLAEEMASIGYARVGTNG